MDSRQFDALVQTLSVSESRRGLLALLATLPMLGGLLGILSPEEARGKERRRRRKQRHKRRKKPGNRKKGCQPKSRATVCAGRCGPVKSRDTCGKTVDCGSCDCTSACEACFTCQGNAGAPGTCVPVASGTPCGTATCASGTLQPPGRCNGAGVCQPTAPVSCEPYTQCDGNACATSCADDSACVPGSFCDGGQCVGDLPDGAPCANDGQCTSSQCVNDVCCASASCPTCQACNLDGTAGTCAVVPDLTGCGGGNVCCDGACIDLQTDAEHCGACGNVCGDGLTCQGGVCGVVCGGEFCPAASEICVDGQCEACDVTCTGDAADCGTALQAALGGSKATVHVCVGTYVGGFSIARSVSVIGAGEGADPASNTVLDGGGAQRVLETTSGTVTLRRLRITRGIAGSDSGGGILNTGATLSLFDCTVAANSGRLAGGIALNDGTLAMTRCTVRDNEAPVDGGVPTGGGLRSSRTATLTDCLIADNTSAGSGGGIYASSGTLNLVGTTRITGNTARQGGGIMVVDADVTIGEACRITGNTANAGEGGGIQTFRGIVTLEGSANPSPIVVDNCQDNCVGGVPKCAATPVSCPP